ncbi:hypothetical protein EXN66_Car019549 [Channa argus]|uniref:Chemokine interleukin-8-like domain-containing protein n=1 Tax=Channa argus TaxID=215402 RepID=A0A6G1QMG6_CHAAH|nr:hypothetical protein EXN66_Car019549 [Channa argus]
MCVRFLSIALLLLSVCLCSQCFAGNRRHPSKGIVHPCCTRVSSVDISAQITGKPSVQKARGKCIEALIIPVRDGKACVDPSAEWVQSFIAKQQ